MLRQVSLKLEAETGVQEIARRHKASVAVLDCKNLNKKDMAFLLDISSPSGSAEAVVSDLKSKGVFKQVYDGEAEAHSSRTLSLAVLNRPELCQAVLDCGVFCLDCPFSYDGDPLGRRNWRLLIRDSEQLKAFLGRLDSLDIAALVGEVSGVKREDKLTPRQSEILAKAISLGYFEFPRRFGITELSKQVGIKPSTLSQVLRSAEEKVMTMYAAETKIKASR